jgi:hypothetical protein
MRTWPATGKSQELTEVWVQQDTELGFRDQESCEEAPYLWYDLDGEDCLGDEDIVVEVNQT